MLFRPQTLPGKIVLYIFVLFFITTVLLPFFWIVLTSFKTEAETFSQPIKIFPSNLNFDNYKTIWQNRSFGRYFLNTILIALFSTLFSIIFASLAGYGFSRFRFTGRSLFQKIILLTQMFPEALLIVPYFSILTKIHLVNSYPALIFAYVSFALPFSTWMLMGFFNSVPQELDESAMVDGCGRWKAFFTIIVPLSAPAIAATAIFSFLLAWNNFLFALVLATSEKMFTLTVGLSTLIGEYSIAWNEIAAATVLASIIVIILYSFLEKYLVAGLTAGAVKG
jgi:multiple sugar transport system permease protein